MRSYLGLLWGLLPACTLKNWLSRGLGYRVHPSARVHPILLLGVQQLAVGQQARIGSFSVFRRLRQMTVHDFGRIGQWNWVSSAPEFWSVSESAGRFSVGQHASITSRHYIDCSGGFTIGEFSTLAGVRSTVITHGISIERSAQQCSGVVVGRYSIVSSNVKLVPGANVPDNSLVAMGAVVTKGLVEPFCIYGGVPARRIISMPRDSLYFSRSEGRVAV